VAGGDRYGVPVDDERGDERVWAAVRAARRWLDEANGTAPAEVTCRILKLTEEAGEAAGAWIGFLGQNPRKGVTHTREEVAAELADAAFTALVAIESLGLDARQVLDTCAVRVRSRTGTAAQDGATPVTSAAGPDAPAAAGSAPVSAAAAD
jgi:NTP pyrophosphatase (non-canonical NTP hydrolase)